MAENPVSKPRYESLNGFERVPLLRGFTEINNLYKLITPLGAFICGGYARYCASPKEKPFPAGDVDIYVKQEENFDKVLNAILEHVPVKITNANAVTFEVVDTGLLAFTPRIQLIKTIKEGKMVAVGSMQTILKNFDFTVVRAAIVNSKTVLVDRDFIHDEKRNILRLKNIHCPISSTLRCCKYARKGYFLRPLECLKLFDDWDNRGQDYRDKIRDGVAKMQGDGELTQEDIDELEKLMRID